MKSMIGMSLHVMFILVTGITLIFIVSLLSVFAACLLVALPVYFFVVKKYSYLNEINK